MSEIIARVADALLNVDYMGESRMTRQEAEALARAVIEEIEKGGQSCGVPGLPTR